MSTYDIAIWYLGTLNRFLQGNPDIPAESPASVQLLSSPCSTPHWSVQVLLSPCGTEQASSHMLLSPPSTPHASVGRPIVHTATNEVAQAGTADGQSRHAEMNALAHLGLHLFGAPLSHEPPRQQDLFHAAVAAGQSFILRGSRALHARSPLRLWASTSVRLRHCFASGRTLLQHAWG